MKKIVMVVFAVLVVSVDLFAAVGGAFSQMNSAGQAAGNAVGSGIYSYRWVFALAPLAAFVAGATWVWNDITKKSEMAQEETKISKIAKPFMGGVAGIFMVYLLYAAFGTAFFTQGANANAAGGADQAKSVSAWDTLVTDFWINAFKGGDKADVATGATTIQ